MPRQLISLLLAAVVALCVAAPAVAQDNAAWIGLTVESLTEQARKAHGIANSVDGVLIAKVTPGSQAESKNFKAGEVIVEVQTNKVRTPEQLFAELRAARQSGRRAVVLFISDNTGRQRFTALDVSVYAPVRSKPDKAETPPGFGGLTPDQLRKLD